VAVLQLVIFAGKASAQDDERLETLQGSVELQATGGYTAFYGDIGRYDKGLNIMNNFNGKVNKPLAGLSISNYVSNWLTVNVNANFTSVAGADSLVKNFHGSDKYRIYRNLSFRSNISEISLTTSFFPLTLIDGTIHGINPYIEMGAGLFKFNPQTYYDGKWVNLQPLHTEGEGFPGLNPATGKKFPSNYQLVQPYIPVTVGAKIFYGNTFFVYFGVTFRHTFTDYIDDVSTVYIDPALFNKYLSPANAILAHNLYQRSLTPWKIKPGLQRGTPGANDNYTTIFIKLSIRLFTGNNPTYRYGG